MNVYLASLGCRLNEAELLTWSKQFESRGHCVVPTASSAQVVVLNTCAVTQNATRSSQQAAKKLHSQNPKAKLVLTGCFADLEPQRVQQLTGVDLVLSNKDKDHLVEHLEKEIDLHAMPEAAMALEPAVPSSPHRTRAFIKVQDGCRNQCTFCIVTVARGEERSRTIADVVTEVRDLHVRGYQEVVLTGVHIGGYGADLGVNLKQLVSAILEETSIPRIRIGSLEPWDLPPGFFQLWQQSDRLCPHFHLPLQSGSDSVIKRMARRCSVAEYKALVHEARARLPNVNITTDLIVGFPGETEEEFLQTTQTLLEIGFGHIHIFSYSPREGTPAARMRAQLPKKTKKARSRVVHQLASRMKRETLETHLHQSTQVLWETRSADPNAPDTIRWTGYTSNYLRAEVKTPANQDLQNTITGFTPVEILAGERLFGVLPSI
jgi:threonylcarbamoyladenosine tRNA methylthiotransferase MtaB